MNTARILEQAAMYLPDRNAVIEDGRRINYFQFNQETNRVASGLSAIGVVPGDYIALCCPNCYEWLTFYFGALKTGSVAVTLAANLTRDELVQIIKDARPKVLFTIDKRMEELGDRNDHEYLEKIVCEQGDLSYEQLTMKGSASFKAVDCRRDSIAAILYTGGTTGIAKGVMLSHENMMTSIHNVSHHERSTPEDCALCFLPLNHVFAQVHIMNSTVYSGGCLVIQPSFDMEKVLHAINKECVTKFYAVPTVYVRLLAIDNLKKKLGSLRYCFSAAASMAAELVREWKTRMGLKIYEAYGMTESASMVTYNHYYRHVIGSVGTPVNTVEIQIRDPEGNVLEPGSEGEICICGPNIMSGYLNRPDDTKSVFWENWFRSGDIGLVDEQGYLYIVDRLKDMIITGGENVYPREIEEVLYTMPEVEECAVIGLPDREYGERVTAFIIPKAGRDIDQANMKTFLKARLSSYKVPKDFMKVSEFPKSSAGKILKRELKRKHLDTK